MPDFVEVTDSLYDAERSLLFHLFDAVFLLTTVLQRAHMSRSLTVVNYGISN